MATNNIINTNFPLTVPDGGTGITAFTNAYATLLAGTTATGAIQDAGVGTSGLVLTSNGAALPTYQTSPSLSGGDMIYISTATASTSATIEIALTGYNFYVINISGLVPDTDAVAFRADISLDSGSTWETGASDYRFQTFIAINGVDSASQSLGTSFIQLGSTNRSNTSTDTAAGTLDILGAAASAYTSFHYKDGYINSAGTTQYTSTFNEYKATTTVDAIRFQMSSGNISTGEFKLYGIT